MTDPQSTLFALLAAQSVLARYYANVDATARSGSPRAFPLAYEATPCATGNKPGQARP
jgi:hypothetical protein